MIFQRSLLALFTWDLIEVCELANKDAFRLGGDPLRCIGGWGIGSSDEYANGTLACSPYSLAGLIGGHQFLFYQPPISLFNSSFRDPSRFSKGREAVGSEVYFASKSFVNNSCNLSILVSIVVFEEINSYMDTEVELVGSARTSFPDSSSTILLLGG